MKVREMAKKAAVMAEPNMATSDLFTLAEIQLGYLKRLFTAASNKDATSKILTNLYVTAQRLGERLGTMTFSERTPTVDDEDDMPEQASEATLADLFAEPDGATGDRIGYLQARLCAACHHELGELVCEECLTELKELCGELNELRVRDFNMGLDLMARGAHSVEEVAKRVLLVAQTVKSGLVAEHFGDNASQMSRRLQEGRQTTHARKKRVIEEPLRKAGIKGFKLGGGSRSDSHRAKCKQAQKGNKSRLKGQQNKQQRL